MEQGARFRTGDVSDDDVDEVDVVGGVKVVGAGIVISEVIVDVNTPPPPPAPGSGLVIASPSLFSSTLVVSEPSVLVVLVVLLMALVGEVGVGFTGKAAVAEMSST